ncbi:MAG: imidazole glycerol phosphate synthase subunit HisH [Bacillota bacterium]|nr:imidazole glycerol phosphate synthase subunit HisH [Bacillota bacterium]
MIGVIDYKAGNAPSVFNAFQKLGHDVKMVTSPGELSVVSGIVLPGVGSADATLSSLQEMGMIEALEEKVLNAKVPFLGICIGMQILFEFSEEGDVPCLGWLKGRVERFDDTKVRVPQMGWNEVVFRKNHRLVEGLGASGHFYYVNSYHVVPENSDDILAVTDYDGEFCCMVQHDNIFAAQFHAEKSGPLGLKIIENFTKIAEEGASC